MNFNLKLKKIRTFRKMTQKELSEKIGLTDQHRIVQYEKGLPFVYGGVNVTIDLYQKSF